MSESMEVEESVEVPSAYLFQNGNAMFFDEEGEQIPEMQKHGWKGLHLFVDEFPEADVYSAVWEETATQIEPENVLGHLKQPDSFDGGNNEYRE